MKPALKRSIETQILIDASETLDEMESQIPNFSWRYLLRVRDETAAYPVVHINMAKARQAWLKSFNAQRRDEMKSIMVMQWGSTMKVPLLMPYVGALDMGLLCLNEGNHTFGAISDSIKIGTGIDVVVHPDCVDKVRNEFGLMRPVSQNLTHMLSEPYERELFLGLGLLQHGTVIDGWRKQNPATLHDDGAGLWVNCDDPKKVIDTHQLLHKAGAVEIYQGARAFPRLALTYSTFNVNNYVEYHANSSIQPLGAHF